MNRSLVLAAIASLGFGGVAPAGLIYGIKSLAPGTGPPSAPPAHLFSFDSDGAGFTDFGAITLFAAQIDADALAAALDSRVTIAMAPRVDSLSINAAAAIALYALAGPPGAPGGNPG